MVVSKSYLSTFKGIYIITREEDKCHKSQKYYKENKQLCLVEIIVGTQQGCSKEVLLSLKLEG